MMREADGELDCDSEAGRGHARVDLRLGGCMLFAVRIVRVGRVAKEW